MSKRRIHVETHTNKNGIVSEAKVYRDSEYNEYSVVFWRHGLKLKGCDYFASDKQDALDTAAEHIRLVKEQDK